MLCMPVAPVLSNRFWSPLGASARPSGSRSASATSRDYVFELDIAGPPALSVFGGKLTTYRRMAEDAVGRAAVRDMGLLTEQLEPPNPFVLGGRFADAARVEHREDPL